MTWRGAGSRATALSHGCRPWSRNSPGRSVANAGPGRQLDARWTWRASNTGPFVPGPASPAPKDHFCPGTEPSNSSPSGEASVPDDMPAATQPLCRPPAPAFSTAAGMKPAIEDDELEFKPATLIRHGASKPAETALPGQAGTRAGRPADRRRRGSRQIHRSKITPTYKDRKMALRK